MGTTVPLFVPVCLPVSPLGLGLPKLYHHSDQTSVCAISVFLESLCSVYFALLNWIGCDPVRPHAEEHIASKPSTRLR